MRRTNLASLSCVFIAISVVFAGRVLRAQPLEPIDFASLGTLDLSNGDFVIDTDTLTITDVTGGGSTLLFTGVADDQTGQADYFNGVWDPARDRTADHTHRSSR